MYEFATFPFCRSNTACQQRHNSTRVQTVQQDNRIIKGAFKKLIMRLLIRGMNAIKMH